MTIEFLGSILAFVGVGTLVGLLLTGASGPGGGTAKVQEPASADDPVALSFIHGMHL